MKDGSQRGRLKAGSSNDASNAVVVAMVTQMVVDAGSTLVGQARSTTVNIDTACRRMRRTD